MTVPALRLTDQSPADVAADVLVLGVTSGKEGPTLAAVGSQFDGVQASLAAIGFAGGKDELRRIPSQGVAAGAIALVGLGSGTPDANGLRYAAGVAARGVTGVDSIALALPVTSEEEALAVLEGAAIGAYSYDRYRSSSLEATKRPATEIVVLAATEGAGILGRAEAIATAVHTVRDLVNMPPSDLYPETFAQTAVELAAGLDVALEILDEEKLRSGGFGGLLGVGQGSTRGPRLVAVRYNPDGASRHLALVGKGITFDSGGLSLKPPASMVGMKYDMTGAATALAVILAAARLGLPVRLTAWLCLAENMPSGSASRPNDVLRMRSGKTVEVLNTDAEGRLVLGDGLAAASEEHPDAVVDIATLTGAASVAMGNRYVATMGDDDVVSRLVAAGNRVGETLWPMPLPPELRSLLDSDVADLANVKIGNTAGGMLIAGIFLREFVGKGSENDEQIPWAHLDIAGAANNAGSGFGFTGKGPTGVTVRALIEMAEEFSRG